MASSKLLEASTWFHRELRGHIFDDRKIVGEIKKARR